MKDFTKELKKFKGAHRGLLCLIIDEIYNLEYEYDKEFDIDFDTIVGIADYVGECCDRYYPGSDPICHIKWELEKVLELEEEEEE